MRLQLINKPNPSFATVEQILYNRGISQDLMKHYLNLSENDICDFLSLGINPLQEAATALATAVKNSEDCVVIIDSDCDGMTSAALLINYLYELFPIWTAAHIHWLMHAGKQHGLNDHMNTLRNGKYKLVICPDSASNDYKCHEELKQLGITTLVLDHHLADKISKDAIIINNQLSNYPNKEASGVCVTWQFCRYLDSLLSTNYADNYRDLVALGLDGDMMSLRSFETRYLILDGFRRDRIKNPFIDYMLDKNDFPLSKSDYVSSKEGQACTSIGAAFFIVPFVNAVTRIGTADEKELVFEAMLNHLAFQKIPEIKRNKLTGKEEYLVLQAVRVIGNVKNRQTREETKGLENLESKIQEHNMLEHGALVFLLEPGEVDAGVRGLIANKLMAKYQKPCIIMTDGGDTYDGSMRGYTKNGLDDFKALLEKCPGVRYVQGHSNAAGISVYKAQLENFLTALDNETAKYPSNPLYRIDYYFKEGINFDSAPDKILSIAAMNDFWGQDIDRAYVGIRCKITANNFSVMKSNTIKISLNNNLSLIKFGATDDEVEQLSTQGWIEIDAYCKCNCNEWNGNSYPQLIIEDYEIIDSCKYMF